MIFTAQNRGSYAIEASPTEEAASEVSPVLARNGWWVEITGPEFRSLRHPFDAANQGDIDVQTNEELEGFNAAWSHQFMTMPSRLDDTLDISQQIEIWQMPCGQISSGAPPSWPAGMFAQ